VNLQFVHYTALQLHFVYVFVCVCMQVPVAIAWPYVRTALQQYLHGRSMADSQPSRPPASATHHTSSASSWLLQQSDLSTRHTTSAAFSQLSQHPVSATHHTSTPAFSQPSQHPVSATHHITTPAFSQLSQQPVSATHHTSTPAFSQLSQQPVSATHHITTPTFSQLSQQPVSATHHTSTPAFSQLSQQPVSATHLTTRTSSKQPQPPDVATLNLTTISTSIPYSYPYPFSTPPHLDRLWSSQAHLWSSQAKPSQEHQWSSQVKPNQEHQWSSQVKSNQEHQWSSQVKPSQEHLWPSQEHLWSSQPAPPASSLAPSFQSTSTAEDDRTQFTSNPSCNHQHPTPAVRVAEAEESSGKGPGSSQRRSAIESNPSSSQVFGKSRSSVLDSCGCNSEIGEEIEDSSRNLYSRPSSCCTGSVSGSNANSRAKPGSPLRDDSCSASIQQALQSVVLIRAHRSWATGEAVWVALSLGMARSCVGLARTIYIRFTYGIFGREITKYTVIYGVYIRFWPTLVMCKCIVLQSVVLIRAYYSWATGEAVWVALSLGMARSCVNALYCKAWSSSVPITLGPQVRQFELPCHWAWPGHV